MAFASLPAGHSAAGTAPTIADQLWKQVVFTGASFFVQTALMTPMLLGTWWVRHQVEHLLVGAWTPESFEALDNCTLLVAQHGGAELLAPSYFIPVFVLSLNCFIMYATNAKALQRSVEMLFLFTGCAVAYTCAILGTGHSIGGMPLIPFVGLLWLSEVTRAMCKKRRSVARAASLVVRVAGLPFCILLFYTCVTGYLLLATSLTNFALEILLLGVIFPMTQMMLRVIFFRVAVGNYKRLRSASDEKVDLGSAKAAEDAAEAEANKEAFLGDLYMVVEVFLALPGFVGLFLLTETRTFLSACSLSLFLEVVGLLLTVRAYSNERLAAFVQQLESTDGVKAGHEQLGPGVGGAGDGNGLVALKRKLAIRIANEEFGEKNALFAAAVLVLAINVKSAPDTLVAILWKVGTGVVLEALADLAKHRVAWSYGIYCSNVETRLSVYTAGTLCTAVLATSCTLIMAWPSSCYYPFLRNIF